MTTEHPDSVRTGANRLNSVVTGELIDTGAENYFETDQALTDTPTLWIPVTTSIGVPVKKFLLQEVQFYMNQTNGVTYQLRLFEASNADDVEQLTDQVFWSPAAQADVTYYRYSEKGYEGGSGTAEVAQYKLPRIVELEDAGKLYYMIDWSGAPGNTPGFIKVKGHLLK